MLRIDYMQVFLRSPAQDYGDGESEIGNQRTRGEGRGE